MSQIIRQHKWGFFILAVVTGFLGGSFFFQISGISPKWILLFLIGIGGMILMGIFRKIKGVLLFLLVVTIVINVDKAFFIHSGHTGGVPGLIVSVWNCILFILYMIWMGEIWTGKDEKVRYMPHFTVVLILLLFWSALSMTQVTRLYLSLFQLFQLVKVILLFFYLANNVRSKPEYHWILAGLLFTFGLELCIGFYQKTINVYVDLGVLSDSSPERARQIGNEAIFGVQGTAPSTDRFGSYLITLLPLILSVVLIKIKLFWKVIFLGMFIGGLILLIFTFSRGAWIGFLISLLLFFFLKLIHSNKRFVSYIQILLIVFIFLFSLYQFKDYVIGRVRGEDYGSAESRIPMMEIAVQMIRANPIFGVGLNHYTLRMPAYDKMGLSHEFFQPVHNVYLQLAAEIGMPGLLLFLTFIGILLYKAMIVLKNGEEQMKFHLIGFLSGVIALLIHYLVNNSTIDSEAFILFWLFCGLIAALCHFHFRLTLGSK